MEHSIAVIDLKAFYAFVECVDRGLNPFSTPLAVLDEERGEGTIVLSVSPYLKELGVPSRCRKRDIPPIKDIVFATPRMQLYIEKSVEVVSIVLDFVGEDDIHIYSIDELFVNLGPYLKMYNCSPYELVKRIKDKIYEKTNLVTTAGIAKNMLLAKVALDVDAKKNPPYISLWTDEDIQNKLWKITPLSKMWGISTNYEKRLNKLGIFTVGQLAKSDKNFLKEKFGIIGEQLWEHANGIDNTDIRDKYIPKETSLSLGQVLFKDYSIDEARLIIKEMVDDLTFRLREHKQKAGVVSLNIGYSLEVYGGFSRQHTLIGHTDDTEIIYREIKNLYEEFVDDLPIRRIGIGLGDLSETEYEQVSLFEDAFEAQDRQNAQKIIDEIQKKYGKNTLLRGSSLLKESTVRERHNQIGGHKK